MGDIALFHSVLGLRPGVLAAAARLRAAGHRVHTPDLYGVPPVDTVEEGFALLDRIGYPTVLDRARAAVRDLPDETVLGGFSMGTGLACAVLPERPRAAALLLLHGIAGSPETVRAGLPVQLHIADPDEYDPPAEVAGWQAAMLAAGVAPEVYRYPGAGHLFTDADLDDHDPAGAERAWERVLAFLAGR